MTRIAHLTDLHFGAEDPVVVDALIDELGPTWWRSAAT